MCIRDRTEILGAYLYGTWWYEYQVAVAVFLESAAKTIHRRSDDL